MLVDKSENAKLITKYMLGRRKHLKGSKNMISSRIPLVMTPKIPITKVAMSEGNSNGLVEGSGVLLFIARVTESRNKFLLRDEPRALIGEGSGGVCIGQWMSSEAFLKIMIERVARGHYFLERRGDHTLSDLMHMQVNIITWRLLL